MRLNQRHTHLLSALRWLPGSCDHGFPSRSCTQEFLQELLRSLLCKWNEDVLTYTTNVETDLWQQLLYLSIVMCRILTHFTFGRSAAISIHSKLALEGQGYPPKLGFLVAIHLPRDACGVAWYLCISLEFNKN